MNHTFSIERVPFDQKHVLGQLLELYTYDFTEFEPFEVDENGLFGYDYFEEYWIEPERHPFFIKVNGKLAGFVLVRILPNTDSTTHPLYSIAEFFIMKRYRRLGIGKAASHQIFKMFPGAWEVFQLENNVPAIGFWRASIRDYTANHYQERQEDGKVIQTFMSRP
ncbi:MULTISPECIES: GNAT family N-acetyltransferase [Brevibacillus]|uniref:GNAT family N-acetyltransferase n=1 Tax=Brevibacillus brevis TaxID=1393 RepID=A0A2Z4MDE1_BREBE|nr:MULTISPECIES: GNAT family N-acetyltransferase [Brevibacillus]AWX54478.1 GNAT family N-acetyltransferase [Brevibacillus brevis]NRR23563.1 GNAT family N-acetyltransferase [Brevibacillus sp. MS2.2]